MLKLTSGAVKLTVFWDRFWEWEMLSSFGIISKGSCCFAAITRSLINWSVSVTVKAIKKKFFELIIYKSNGINVQ